MPETHEIKLRGQPQALIVKFCARCFYLTHKGEETECPVCRDAEGGCPLSALAEVEQVAGESTETLRERVKMLARALRVQVPSRVVGLWRTESWWFRTAREGLGSKGQVARDLGESILRALNMLKGMAEQLVQLIGDGRLLRALLRAEAMIGPDDTRPCCGTTPYLEEGGRAPHAEGCDVDASLTALGYPTLEERDELRAQMRKARRAG